MQTDEQIRLVEGVSYQAFGADDDGVMLSLQSGYLYRCNPTALQLLARLRGGATMAELQSSLTADFELSEGQARSDAQRFVADLLAENLACRVVGDGRRMG